MTSFGLEPSPRLRKLEQAILRHDSALELAALPDAQPPARHSRRPAAVAGAVVVLAVAASLSAPISSAGGSVSAAPNSVAVLDSGGRLVSAVRVGSRPSALAVGAAGVWALNGGDGTATRIDPHTLSTRTVGVGTSANSIAYGEGALWVGSDRGLLRVDPATQLSTPISLGLEPSESGGQALPRGVTGLIGDHGIWATAGNPGVLFRISADGHARREPAGLTAPGGPLSYAAGALWSADSGTLDRLDLRTGTTSSVMVDPDAPNGFGGASLSEEVASGNGFVWATAPYAHEVVASPRGRCRSPRRHACRAARSVSRSGSAPSGWGRSTAPCRASTRGRRL